MRFLVPTSFQEAQRIAHLTDTAVILPHPWWQYTFRDAAISLSKNTTSSWVVASSRTTLETILRRYSQPRSIIRNSRVGSSTPSSDDSLSLSSSSSSNNGVGRKRRRHLISKTTSRDDNNSLTTVSIIPSSAGSSSSSSSRNDQEQEEEEEIVLVVSRTSFEAPLDTAFSTRLNALNNIYVTLETENAYVSTLGGGAFLCKHLGMAVRAAHVQMKIAMLLQDIKYFARARIHLVYIAIAAGRWRTAFFLLKQLETYALQTGDSVLLSMVHAGKLYRRKTIQWHKQGLLSADPHTVAMRKIVPALEAGMIMGSGSGSGSAGKTSEDDLHSEASSGSSTPSSVAHLSSYEQDPHHWDDVYRQRLVKYTGRIM